MIDSNVPQAREGGSGTPADDGRTQKSVPLALGSPDTNAPDNPDTTPYRPWMGNDPLQEP